MAQQDDIIEINTVEEISTSILDYFLNVALVTPITETTEEDDGEGGTVVVAGDLLPDEEFSEDGYEVYTSLSAVAEKFATTSKIYKIATSVFAQKNNNGVNQSNLKRFVVIEKKDTDLTFADALNRVGYKNAYYLLINQTSDTDVLSANTWVSGYRKLLFAQTDSNTLFDNEDTDLASVLKNANADRTALYYHEDNATESLAGALASILAGYPVGGKGASYKNPTGITVDELTDTQEDTLTDKNTNFYVHFIGGAGDYSTRELTSSNGVTSGGTEIEKQIAIDRIVLSLQAGLMDALEQDIPYDDRGGTIVYGKVNKVFATLKNEGILAVDSVDETTGEIDKSYTIHVVPIATVKREYSDYYAKKEFIVKCTLSLAGVAKRIAITIAY